MTSARKRRSVAKKLVASAALLGGALSLAFGGAFATFTDTASGSPQTIASGTIALAATSVNTAGAMNIVPGDTIAREVDLNSTSATAPDANITLSVKATTSSLLDQDPTNGLQLSVQDCASAPTLSSTTYTCPAVGGFTTVTLNNASSASVSSLEKAPAVLGGLQSVNPGNKDYLVMNIAFPSSAPGDPSQYVPQGGAAANCSGAVGGTAVTENMQGCSSVLTYGFTATQRAGAPQ